MPRHTPHSRLRRNAVMPSASRMVMYSFSGSTLSPARASSAAAMAAWSPIFLPTTACSAALAKTAVVSMHPNANEAAEMTPSSTKDTRGRAHVSRSACI